MKWTKITTILAFIHITIFTVVWVLQDSIDLGIVNDIVLAGTVYIPLLLWGAVGINVVQGTGAILPPPTIIGWILCILSWLMVYMVVGYIVAKIGKGKTS